MEPRGSRRGTRINCKNPPDRAVDGETGHDALAPSLFSQRPSDDWSITTPGPMVEDTVTRFM